MEMNGGETISNNNCAVCLEIINNENLIVMPCCGTTGSTIQYCKLCIEVIAQLGIEGRIGRCPTCMKYYEFVNGVVVSNPIRSMQCRMCCQLKVIADLRRNLCDKCLLGQSFSFSYECNRCHRIQRIPHPMWQYQASPTEFTTASWACHLGCDDYTFWRIVPDDILNVPPEHCPEQWGRREEWLTAVRDRRRENGNNVNGNDVDRNNSCNCS